MEKMARSKEKTSFLVVFNASKNRKDCKGSTQRDCKQSHLDGVETYPKLLLEIESEVMDDGFFCL